jgi:hypothetical protein
MPKNSNSFDDAFFGKALGLVVAGIDGCMTALAAFFWPIGTTKPFPTYHQPDTEPTIPKIGRTLDCQHDWPLDLGFIEQPRHEIGLNPRPHLCDGFF